MCSSNKSTNDDTGTHYDWQCLNTDWVERVTSRVDYDTRVRMRMRALRIISDNRLTFNTNRWSTFSPLASLHHHQHVSTIHQRKPLPPAPPTPCSRSTNTSPIVDEHLKPTRYPLALTTSVLEAKTSLIRQGHSEEGRSVRTVAREHWTMQSIENDWSAYDVIRCNIMLFTWASTSHTHECCWTRN